MNFNESVKQLLKNAIHQLNRVEAATVSYKYTFAFYKFSVVEKDLTH